MHAIRNEVRAGIRQLLSQLDERDREVLVLRFLEQLSTEDTADVLGLTMEGVRTRQRRALERFSNLLANTEDAT